MAADNSQTESALLKRGRNLLRATLSLVYPPSCFLCDASLPLDATDRFCPDCLDELTGDDMETCPRCAETIGPFSASPEGCPRCLPLSFHFERAYRLGLYQGRLRELLLRMKRRDGEGLAEVFASLWAETMAVKLRGLPVDCVIPVPLHWIRRWQRGFNQSEYLARALAARLGVARRSHWLGRRRHTPHQTDLPATARRRNVQGAFIASPRPELRHRTVLLVDDILTTGSTCSEAARALKQGGARSVVVAVVARSRA